MSAAADQGFEVRFVTPPGEQAQVDFAQFPVVFTDESPEGGVTARRVRASGQHPDDEPERGGEQEERGGAGRQHASRPGLNIIVDRSAGAGRGAVHRHGRRHRTVDRGMALGRLGPRLERRLPGQFPQAVVAVTLSSILGPRWVAGPE